MKTRRRDHTFSLGARPDTGSIPGGSGSQGKKEQKEERGIEM